MTTDELRQRAALALLPIVLEENSDLSLDAKTLFAEVWERADEFVKAGEERIADLPGL